MKRNPYLRVKLKSLAAEAKIIRLEEQRANQHKDYELQTSLHLHRAGVVRSQSRHTLLAYQFLRGVPYAAVEGKVREGNLPSVLAIANMVRKYGAYADRTDTVIVERWLAGKSVKTLLKAA